MASKKQRTTMAKFQRETRVRERRAEKEMRKDQRKQAGPEEVTEESNAQEGLKSMSEVLDELSRR